MLLENSLNEFESTLNILAKPLVDILEDGEEKNQVANLLRRIKIDDPNLITLYSWRNGMKNTQQYKIAEYDICSFGKFLNASSAISLFLAFKSSMQQHTKYLFPVITNLAGDFLYFETNKKSKSYGQLLLYSAELLVTKPITAFDSLSNFFNSIAECYQKGIYKFDVSSNYLDIDFEREHELFKLNNPKSKYWSS